MRILILLPVLIALSGGAPAPKPKNIKVPHRPAKTLASLPVFSFMGEDTETVTSRTELNGKECARNGALLECADYGISHLAGAPILMMTMSFNNGKIYRLMGTTNYTRYTTLLEAFTVKYGKPSISKEKWQAKSGAEFDNSVARWLFKGGLLELQSRGVKADEPMFLFVSSDNAPPADKPKIDF